MKIKLLHGFFVNGSLMDKGVHPDVDASLFDKLPSRTLIWDGKEYVAKKSLKEPPKYREPKDETKQPESKDEGKKAAI